MKSWPWLDLLGAAVMAVLSLLLYVLIFFSEPFR